MRRLAVLALFVIAGCAGIGPSQRIVPQGDLQPRASLPKAELPGLAARAANVIKTTNWIVPKGSTRTVNGTLAVFATGKIEIDGTLSIAPTASIGLIALGPLTISGRVALAGKTVVAEPFGSTALPIAVLGGSNVTISGGTQWPGNVAMVTNRDGLVTIGATMTLANGANGTSAAATDMPGGAQSGGTLDIGSRDARHVTFEWIGKYDPNLTGFSIASPRILTISSKVAAGAGGGGFSDVNGKLAGGARVLLGGNGANGGNVNLFARRLNIGKTLVIPGNGGNGGNAGFDATGVHFDAPMDGKSGHEAGLPLRATLGNGGNAGTVTTTGFVNGIGGRAGGGDAGKLQYARAGNGGLAGSGGTTNVTPGSPGTGSSPGALGVIILAGGGNGGSSLNAKDTGATGGPVSVLGKNGFDAAGSSVSSYANGGDGFSGCPTRIGTDGGDAGNLNTLKAHFGKIRNSFDGGNGGDGIGPVGKGGLQGVDPQNKPVGVSGKHGFPCTSNFVFVPDRVNETIHEYAIDQGSVPNPVATIAAGPVLFGVTDPVNPYYYGLSSGITVFSISKNGAVSFIASRSTPASPVSAVSDGKYVYTANAQPQQGYAHPGSVSVFSAGPSLTPIGTNELTQPAIGIALDSLGLYVIDGFYQVGCCYYYGSLVEFSRNPDGSLTALSNGDSYGPEAENPTAIFDTGESLYVATYSGFTTNPTPSPEAHQYSVGTGGATPLSPSSFSLPPAGAGSIACTQTMCFMGSGNEILQYSIGVDGSLSPLATPSVPGTATFLALDPSETHLYAATGSGLEGWNVTASGLTPLFGPRDEGYYTGNISIFDFANFAHRRAPRRL